MSYPLFPDNSFPPARNKACFCESGERFKHCCGLQSRERRPPAGLNVMENFLSDAECQELVALADAIEGNRFTVSDTEGKRMLDKQRMTEWVDFRDSQQHILDGLVAKAIEEQIIPQTGQNVEWYEEPQLLRYSPGDYYLHHSDSYQFVPAQEAWRKVVDRDISILIYLNDGYQGGGVDFKRFSYTLQPKKGMLVWFPSDVRYEHMAMPVTSGRRYALVSWLASSGVPRVQSERAKRSILWETREKKLSGE